MLPAADEEAQLIRRWIPRLMVVVLASATMTILGGGAVGGQTAVLFGGTGGPDDPSDLLVLDPSTGAVSGVVGATGYGLTGLAISPIDGAIYGSTTNNGTEQYRALVRIDRATGAATEIATFDSNVFPVDLTFTPDGTLYGWFETADELGIIDTTTGDVTIVGPDFNTYGGGLAYDAVTGRTFLAGNGQGGALSLVDLSTGEIEEFVQLDGENDWAISALAFTCDGVLYASIQNFDEDDRPAFLATIDPDTGTVTILGSSADRLDAIAWDGCEASPEPPGPPGPRSGPAPAIQTDPRFTG